MHKKYVDTYCKNKEYDIKYYVFIFHWEKTMGKVYIEMLDLVANALIFLLDNNKEKKISFATLDKYGAKVREFLAKENGTDVYLYMSRESQDAIFEDYSEFFEQYNDNGTKGIKLKNDITSENLWEKFCLYLPLDVLKAFDDSSVQEVLAA